MAMRSVEQQVRWESFLKRRQETCERETRILCTVFGVLVGIICMS